MLDKTGVVLQALLKLVDIYGFDYIKKHKNSPYAYKEEDDGTFTISFLFESNKDRPDIPSDYLGWAVYATVNVNPETTEVVLNGGRLQNGSKIS